MPDLPPHLRNNSAAAPATPPLSPSRSQEPIAPTPQATKPDLTTTCTVSAASSKDGKESSLDTKQDSAGPDGVRSTSKSPEPSTQAASNGNGSSVFKSPRLEPDLSIGEGESKELYRGLLKDVDDYERDLRNRAASQSEGENERTSKKVKKKKDKKKKDGSKDKEKKKRRGSKASKSPHFNEEPSKETEPKTSSPLRRPSDSDRQDTPVKTGKRSHSSDSASSVDSPTRGDKKRLDNSNSELFNVALTIPPMYQPPVGDPYFQGVPNVNLNVPPPGYNNIPIIMPHYNLPAPTETIDDPLAAFNKHLREKDERKRREQMRRNRSPSYTRYQHRRSWSRSRSRSPGGRRGRSPWSRRPRWSKSRSPSPGRHYPPPLSHMGRHHSPPSSHKQQYPPSPGHHRGYPPSSPPSGGGRHHHGRLRKSPPSSHRHQYSSPPPLGHHSDRQRSPPALQQRSRSVPLEGSDVEASPLLERVVMEVFYSDAVRYGIYGGERIPRTMQTLLQNNTIIVC